MNNITKILITILAIACISLTVYAYTNYQATRTWTVTERSFTVDRDLTLNYGYVENGTVETETFTISNTGNIDITVTADCTASGATVSWDTQSQTIPVAQSKTYTLTLTITASGSCIITFATQ